MKHIGKIVAIVCGAVVFLVIALQILLNMPFVSRTVGNLAAEYVDGELSFSELRFSALRTFPNLKVSVDSLSITYPHNRYSAYDKASVRSRLLDAGRGPVSDTLASLRHFSAAVNPFQLALGRIRIGAVKVEGLSLFAHQYDTTANWAIFKTGEPDTLKESKALPWISLGRVSIIRPRVVFTSQYDTVFIAASFDSFRLHGAFKPDTPEGVPGFKDVALKLDNLKAHGRLPADTLDLALDSLAVTNPFRHMLEIGMDAKVNAFTSAFGRVTIPISIDADAELEQGYGKKGIDLRSLNAELAYIPISARGRVKLRDDATDIDLHAAIENCDLARVVDGFSTSLPLLASQFDTDASLTLEVDANGVLSESSVPQVKARISIPDSRVYYEPMDLLASVGIDASASLSANKSLRAVLGRVAVRGSGVEVSAKGQADRLLGENPLFDVHASAYAVADSLLRFLRTDKDIKAGGKLSVKLDANTSLKEINALKFHNSVISGDVTGDSLFFSVPEDTLDAVIGTPVITLRSNPEGLAFATDIKKAFLNKGDSLHVRVRDMKNLFRMYMTEERGEQVPKLSLDTDNRSVFLKTGPHRLGLMGFKAGASIQMRPRKNMQLRRQFLDSLHRAHPGVSVDSLLLVAAAERRGRLPDFMRNDELSAYDVDIKLDSTLSKYFKIWKPSGNVSVRRGFVSTPVYPLRTSISAFDLSFTDNEIKLDTLKILSGMSDVTIKGKVKGLRRALLTKGMIRADMDVQSRKFNLNELATALDMGTRTKDIDADTLSESEGSYLVDSIADAKMVVLPVPLVVIPANLDINVNVGAGELTVADVEVNPVSAHLRLKDRTAQLSDVNAHTNLGNVAFNAFYSSRSKKDITMGADMRLSDVSAEGIIRMLPNVDEMMPALKSFEGKLNMDLSVTSSLDSNMNVVMPTVEGIMRIGGKNLNISDAGNLRRITSLLMFKDKNIGHINDMSVDAVVHDSKLEVFPFELAVDRYRLVLRGTQGLDKEMNYHISVIKSPFLIPFGINIYGYTDNWRFLIGLPKYREGRIPVYTKQLDTVQVNILQSIKDVYNKGIDNVRKASRTSQDIALNSSQENTGNGMSMECLDSLSFSMALAREEAELDAEVEQALKEQPFDIKSIIMEYDTSEKDAFIERRIRQLKKSK